MVLKLGQREDFLYWESRREREKKKKGGSVEEREKYGRHIKALTELSLRVMNVQ